MAPTMALTTRTLTSPGEFARARSHAGGGKLNPGSLILPDCSVRGSMLPEVDSAGKLEERRSLLGRGEGERS